MENEQVNKEVEIVEKPQEEIVKEELPVSFLTDWVSKGWEEVGALQQTVSDLRERVIGGNKVARILQDLADAYLLCIGQLELHLHDNDYLDGINDEDLVKEDEEEAIEDEKVEEPVEEAEEEEEEIPAAEVKVEPVKDTSKDEILDYFVDFDDPDLSEPRITDAEIDKLYKRVK